MRFLSLPLSTVVQEAEKEASRLSERYVSTEHLLLGLTNVPESRAAELLAKRQVTLESLRERIQRSPCSRTPVSAVQMTPRAQRVLHLARSLSIESACSTIGTHHLLAALLLEGEGLAAMVLRTAGMDEDTLRHDVTVLPCEGE